MPASTPTVQPSRPGQPRLLNGIGGSSRTRSGPRAGAAPAAVPFKRQQIAPASTPAAQPVPRWAKGVAIGGVLLAVAMPVAVLMSRSMLVQEALAQQSDSRAAMVCTAGDARAIDNTSLVGWLFGGSYFSCGDWETREARVQRERDQAHNNYMARERLRQGLQ